MIGAKNFVGSLINSSGCKNDPIAKSSPEIPSNHKRKLFPTISFLDDSDPLAQIMPYGMAPSEFTERAPSDKLFDT